MVILLRVVCLLPSIVILHLVVVESGLKTNVFTVWWGSGLLLMWSWSPSEFPFPNGSFDSLITEPLSIICLNVALASGGLLGVCVLSFLPDCVILLLGLGYLVIGLGLFSMEALQRIFCLPHEILHNSLCNPVLHPRMYLFCVLAFVYKSYKHCIWDTFQYGRFCHC